MDDLDAYISTILENGSPFAYSFLTFVKGKIDQFNLGTRLEVGDVISMAYDRTRKSISEGEKIENMLAWLKSVSFNIIREQSRKTQKEKPADPQKYIFDIPCLMQDKEVKDGRKSIRKLDVALQALAVKRPEDCQLIQLYYFEKKSYKEIAAEQSLGPNISPAALRKRMSRALKQLRAIYHASFLNV